MELFHLLLYVLILGSVHASLPYHLSDTDDDPLVPRDVPPADLYLLSTSVSPSGILSSAPAIVYPTTSTSKVNSSRGTASVLATSIVTSLTPPSSGLPSTFSASLSNRSSQAFASSIYLTSTSKLSIVTSSSGIASGSASTLSVSFSGTSNSSQNLPSSISTISPTSSSSIHSTPDTPVSVSQSLVTTTVTASNGAPSTLIVTATLSQDTSSGEIMSSSQPSQASTAPAAIPTAPSLEAVIGGVGYQLPSSDQDAIDVMLQDGSIAQLLANKIIIGSQTVTVPSDLTSETALSDGITAKPGEATEPEEGDDDDDNGGGGGGGLFGALGGIAKGATSAIGGAIDGVGSVTAGAIGFAGGTVGAAAGLSEPLSGAVGNMGKFVSSLNGIQKSFPGNELTKGALDTFTGAQSLARQSLNWMKSTSNLAQDFPNLPADVQSKLKSTAADFAKDDGPLAQCKAAIEAFRDFPWEEAEVPSQTVDPDTTEKATNTASLQSTQGTSTAQTTSMKSSTVISSTAMSASSTVTSSQTSSSSSETPTPTPDATKRYGIMSEYGTSWETFKQFITELDGGNGYLAKLDSTQQQIYIAKLNASQVSEIKERYDFIGSVLPYEFDETIDHSIDEFRAIGQSRSLHTDLGKPPAPKSFMGWSAASLDPVPHLIPRALLPSNPDAPWWKKMLSAPPRDIDVADSGPQFDPPYLADDSLGKGVTIYVLDDGFDTDNVDLQAGTRSVNTIVTPNELTSFPVIPYDPAYPDRTMPERIQGGDHGTMMATIAAGVERGISPKADLCLVKTKNTMKSKFDPNVSYTLPITTLALAWFIDAVMKDIVDRTSQDPGARSVINMSWGIQKPGKSDDEIERITKIFENFLDFCKARSIPVVVAAGNMPAVNFVHDSFPQRLWTADDTMIIVGGVTDSGALYEKTVEDPNNQITVHAPAKPVTVPKSGGITPPEGEREGTSHAAAITSGLIAYLYGLPNWQEIPYVQQTPMKTILKDHAWLRSNAIASNDRTAGKVVYNLARGDPFHGSHSCVQRRDKFGKRQDEELCSLSSILPTSMRSVPGNRQTPVPLGVLTNALQLF
ncbi:hypothetical protein AA0111_g12041 [Alternaria arborescens]|uniref:hypothetical protein n=1 Tax=Alternaria arborescens TaxID=156630 RepID=UPI0010758D31|nr:hypothetical protein AA0111_g12041 [Alternaria arborescens]RYO14266.1 hypothetical protein AA0111_g12041 [Alternaria arborescens]